MAELGEKVMFFWSEQNTLIVKAMRERLYFLSDFKNRRAFQYSRFKYPGSANEPEITRAELAMDELYSIFGENSLGFSDERLIAYAVTQAERLERKLNMLSGSAF